MAPVVGTTKIQKPGVEKQSEPFRTVTQCTWRDASSQNHPAKRCPIDQVQSCIYTTMFARYSTRALVSTSLRSVVGRRQLSASKKLVSKLQTTSLRRASSVSTRRFKSSAAAAVLDDYDDDDDVVSDASIGHKAAAEQAVASTKTHEEAWMVNLGRGNDNEWLTGPRPEEWFTGLAPSKCPGKNKMFLSVYKNRVSGKGAVAKLSRWIGVPSSFSCWQQVSFGLRC